MIKKECHQYVLKKKHLEEDLKSLPFDSTILMAKDFVLSLEPKLTLEIENFIKKYEWLGRVGVNPKWIFTARYQGILGGVVMINEPTSYSKLLGPETKKYEAMIQRGACASWTPKNLGSRLIMYSCNWMVNNTEKRCFVAYSDFEAGEFGTIYQACNFDYLGDKFGNREMYIHEFFKGGRPFSSQDLRRTSTLKKWAREHGIKTDKSWFKANGFKDLSKVPENIQLLWRLWQKHVLEEAIIIRKTQKGKYILVLGKNKREQRQLNSLKNYQTKKYPKR